MSISDIRKRFEADVDRFSDLQGGQEAVMDAPIMMDLICHAAAAITPAPTRILDIGCGAGNNSIKLMERTGAVECHLVDLSRAMLDRASQRIADISDKPVLLYEGDIRSINLPGAAFDVIIAAAVLHHLRDDADWEKTFNKIYNLSAPGGSIWITDMVYHQQFPL